MKKMFSLLIAALFVLSLSTACTKKAEKTETPAEKETTTVVKDTSAADSSAQKAAGDSAAVKTEEKAETK
jgi:ABC-type Zn uptake system ZnuABC Zn-binding protein ZnuA